MGLLPMREFGFICPKSKNEGYILLVQASSSSALWASDSHQSLSSMLVPCFIHSFNKFLLNEYPLVPCDQDRQT